MSSAISYVSEVAIVINSEKIKRHSDPQISSLAAKVVKVFPETAHEVFFEGQRMGKTVMVVPLHVSGDMRPRWILTKHLLSSDPIVLKLKS